MSYLPSQTTKSLKLREQFRKAKRKQVVTITAAVLAVVLAVFLVVVLVMFVRSLFNSDTSIPRATFATQHAESKIIEASWSTVLQPAPWFTLHGNAGLVIAGDTNGDEAGFPSMPVNFLSGYSRDNDGPSWRVEHDGPLTDVALANNRVITFRQMLSEPPGIELAAYSAEDGSGAWSFQIESAQQGAIEISGKVVCLTYQMPDGPRIAGYSVENGAKVWGLRIPLDEDNDGSVFTDQVYLDVEDGYLAYYIDRFFGLVDTSSGKLLRRYSGQGHVIDAAISFSDNQIFLLESTLGEEGYRLVTLPFRDGNPVTIHEYSAAGGGFLLSSGLFAILVFNEPTTPDGEPGAGFVAGFTTSSGGPKFVHKLPEGFIDDAMPIPGTAGEFLLASNPGRTSTGLPRGSGSLLRVRFSNQGLEEVAKFNQPVSWLVPFQQQCVVLFHGGRVATYLNDLEAAVAIDKLRYPNLEPRMNPARNSLAVISYQSSFAAGDSSGSMAVTIFD